MTPEETTAFIAFWDHVRRAEEDVRKNWYRGHPTPDVIGDPWDQDFANAYDAIHPSLQPFVWTRMVLVPPGIPLLNPYSAENWHQALMFFLNPPHQIYGSETAFKSPEYQRIKSGALRELSLLESTNEYVDEKILKADAPKGAKGTKSRSERIQQEIRRLRLAIFEYHFPHGKDPVREPLTIEQILDLLPDLRWSQPTASRRMAALFKGGMSTYERWSGNPKLGVGGAYDARTNQWVPIADQNDDEADEDDENT